MKRASFALALASLLLTSGALADLSQQCVEAAEHGQKLRDDRKLIEAREQFVFCSRSGCPLIVARDCTAWAERSNAEIPKLVPRAKDDDGQDLVSVRLFVDGKVYAETLDGRRILMDPGAHAIRFEAPGREPHEENVVLAEADVRLLTVTLHAQRAVPSAAPIPAPAPTTPTTSDRRGPPVATYVFGAVSLAGFASFAYFAATGSSDESGLSDGCSKTKSCSRGSVDDVRTKYLVADISLGVGVVALGAAVALWVLRPSPSTTATLRIAPSGSGAVMTGTF